ncbi:MAG: hypothetical protein K0R67_1781 [Paenibacillus sp.]|nr:hypothetical protein [Paenibacillus sp.]
MIENKGMRLFKGQLSEPGLERVSRLISSPSARRVSDLTRVFRLISLRLLVGSDLARVSRLISMAVSVG